MLVIRDPIQLIPRQFSTAVILKMLKFAKGERCVCMCMCVCEGIDLTILPAFSQIHHENKMIWTPVGGSTEPLEPHPTHPL